MRQTRGVDTTSPLLQSAELCKRALKLKLDATLLLLESERVLLHVQAERHLRQTARSTARPAR